MTSPIFARAFRLNHLALNAVLMMACSTWATNAQASPANQTQHDAPEETYVFAGACANGEKYRLFLYQHTASGTTQSYYDYVGPAGQGTIQSDAAPKVMAVRVCRKTAELIDANYWERVSDGSSRH